MVKHICCLLLFLCMGLPASKAQYVAIPDTLFAFWLDSTGYSSCLTGNSTIGWQMDTTCSLVRNATTIDCSNYGIKDLTGVTYFDNLRSLSCGGLLALSYIPPLPAGLQYLTCPLGNLTSLPVLPAGLKSLICYKNKITALPAIPNSVRTLICASNNITYVPNLPDVLGMCAFDSNPDLRCLPELKQISTLYFTNTSITCLPNYGNVTNSYPALNTVPICTDDNNTNGCQLVSSVSDGSYMLYKVKIIPNPTASVSCIHIDESLVGSFVSITDPTGRVVVQTQLTTINTQLSTQNLPNGLYFILVRNGSTTSTQRLLIQK